jgi:hypothetical protein
MKINFLYALLVALLFSACSLFQGDSFSGTWKMTWKSDSVNEEIDYVVAEDNSFKFDHTFFIQGNPMPIDFEGTIGEEGEMTGDIIIDGNKVGTFKGTCDYEKGEGTWRGGNYSGTWSTVSL